MCAAGDRAKLECQFATLNEKSLDRNRNCDHHNGADSVATTIAFAHAREPWVRAGTRAERSICGSCVNDYGATNRLEDNGAVRHCRDVDGSGSPSHIGTGVVGRRAPKHSPSERIRRVSSIRHRRHGRVRARSLCAVGARSADDIAGGHGIRGRRRSFRGSIATYTANGITEAFGISYDRGFRDSNGNCRRL
jgi:hypothetical protein